MKITDIEIIPIYPRIAARNAAYTARFHDMNHLTVFKVQTDAGVVGYGEFRCTPPPRSYVEPLIGRSPFDFINNTFNPGLGGALYDAMGKYLDVPAYKLMGQKVRDGVSVAAWTRTASPELFAAEVQRAAAEGYTIFKMHTCAYYDVIEQTQAAQKVAPPDFKIHYDFNSNRTLAAVLPIIRELEQYPVVGYIEDPMTAHDLDGWRRLREQTRLPIIMHKTPVGHLQELLFGVADSYMLGGSIGEALILGAAYGRANTQVTVQFGGGGTLAKALTLHVMAVLPTATGHSVNLDDQYEEDIATERIPVIEGFSPVPDGPGLGVEVDEETLARVAANEPTVPPKHIGVIRLPNGRELHTPSFSHWVSHPEAGRWFSELTGHEEGSIRGITMELWEDDGSVEFARTHARAAGQVAADH